MLQVLTIHLLGLQLLLALQSIPNVSPEIKAQAEALAQVALNFKESDVTPTVTTQTAPTQVQIVGSIPLQASTSPIETPVLTQTPPAPIIKQMTPSITFKRTANDTPGYSYSFTLKDANDNYLVKDGREMNTLELNRLEKEQDLPRQVNIKMYKDGVEFIPTGNYIEGIAMPSLRAFGSWGIDVMSKGTYHFVFSWNGATAEDTVEIK